MLQKCRKAVLSLKELTKTAGSATRKISLKLKNGQAMEDKRG